MLSIRAPGSRAHRITEGQPFLDGNKRLALVAVVTFLEINGYRVDATHPEQRFLIQPER
jgi:prophage maintenance system killer protein